MGKVFSDIFIFVKQFLVFLLIFSISLIVFSIVSATFEKAHGKTISYIKVPSLVFVNDKKIYLGDIAEIHVEDENLKFFAKRISIGASPVPGQSRFLKGRYVKNLIDNKLMGQVRVIVPKKIKVVSRVRYLTNEDIKRDFILHLRSSGVWRKRIKNGGRLVLDGDFKIKPITVPERKVNVTFKIAENDDLLGPTNVEIRVYDQGKILKKLWFRTNISFSGEIVIAKRNIKAGEILDDTMVELRRITIDNAPHKFFTNLSEVLEKRLRTYVKKGFAITGNIVESPPMVNYGDMVKVVAESGSISIVGAGKSYQKGYMGSMIKIQNLKSKKYVMGKVTGYKEVTVTF